MEDSVTLITKGSPGERQKIKKSFIESTIIKKFNRHKYWRMDYFTGNTPAERLVCDTLYAIEARPKTGPFAGQEMLKTLIIKILTNQSFSSS